MDGFSAVVHPEGTAAGKANSSALATLWGRFPALGSRINIPQLPSAGHVGLAVCIQPCQWPSIAWAVLFFRCV